VLCGLVIGAPASSGVNAQTITFGGYQWQVKSGTNLGPGPNTWNASNVWLDSQGALHLKISHANGVWSCAEVDMTQSLGFGTYQFQVTGRIDQLDKSVVLGLFNYPTPDVGPDGTNEIDIEFAHWGNAAWPNGNYTVWPAKAGVKQTSSTFNFKLNGNATTHRFTWKSQSILFQSLNGHRDDNKQQFAHWLFKPTDYTSQIPQKPIPVMLNLWLFQGQPPSDGNEVELVVSSFKFTPAK
jgi:hypothetical protein